jgi:hypothetical protein
MFAPCINSKKTLFIIPTDAHYYKSVKMLKQFKVITLAPTCFSSSRNHYQGAVLCLATTTDMVFSVLVDMDSVNAMASLTESISTSTEKPLSVVLAKHRTAP